MMMALLLNKYILKPFKQNRNCESLMSNLFTCVDSLATVKRRNHSALRFEMTKFPFPDTVDAHRHQLVKPRPPPTAPTHVNSDYQQENAPPAWKNERTETVRPTHSPNTDDHVCTDDKDTDVDNDAMNTDYRDKKCKVSKTDRSLMQNVLGSRTAGFGQKFRGFINSLKSTNHGDFDHMPKKMVLMKERFQKHRKPDTGGQIVAPTLMEKHEQKQENHDDEQRKKMHTIFKGQALRMAMHKEREKELTSSLEKMKIAKRMRYLMKLQHVMETKEPITDSSVVQRNVPLYAELRCAFQDKKHISQTQFAFAPYTPADPNSDNADIPHKIHPDNSKTYKSETHPGIGDSHINRLCKGLSLSQVKRNRY